jgi:hypothetical protein
VWTMLDILIIEQFERQINMNTSIKHFIYKRNNNIIFDYKIIILLLKIIKYDYIKSIKLVFKFLFLFKYNMN